MKDEYDLNWDVAVELYVRAVSLRGTDPGEVKQAWREANKALDRLVAKRAEEDAERETAGAPLT